MLRGCFAESEIMHIHLQLVLALSHIHKVKILHRDLTLGKKKQSCAGAAEFTSDFFCFGCFVVCLPWFLSLKLAEKSLVLSAAGIMGSSQLGRRPSGSRWTFSSRGNGSWNWAILESPRCLQGLQSMELNGCREVTRMGELKGKAVNYPTSWTVQCIVIFKRPAFSRILGPRFCLLHEVADAHWVEMSDKRTVQDVVAFGNNTFFQFGKNLSFSCWLYAYTYISHVFGKSC